MRPEPLDIGHVPPGFPSTLLGVYVASSWRNPLQQIAVKALRQEGISTYDFRNPFSGSNGFHWGEVGGMPQGEHQPVSPQTYLDMIAHPRAEEAYHDNDLAAMQWCSHLIMVLPCGRSAHAEAGWAAGMGKHTAVWLAEDPMEPELMYKMFEFMSPSLSAIVDWVYEP